MEESRTPALVLSLALGVAIMAWWFATKRPNSTTVTDLLIYPIKSCAEVHLTTATATARGFAGDRAFQVTDRHGKYCTPRDAAKSKLFQVACKLSGTSLNLTAPGIPLDLNLDLSKAETTTSPVEVLCAPERLHLRDFGDEAAKWLDEATGISGCRLSGWFGMDGGKDGDTFCREAKVNPDQGDEVPVTGAPVSLADEAPYLMTSVSSLADLNKRLRARGKPAVDMRRFRPNIVIDGLRPWEEDCIRRLRIDGVEFHAWQRCGRCTMTTIDRDTLERGPEPLATLSTFRERSNGQRNFGMHLVPAKGLPSAGRQIWRGSVVEVLEIDEARRAEWESLFGRGS